MKLQSLVLESEEMLLSEFSIKPEKSSYYIHSDDYWQDFLNNTGSHPDSYGVYLPRSLSAHLKQSSEFLAVNLLHEYFGHGLFCEYAITGQRIVTLEQALAETEKKILNLSEIPKQQHFQVDETNPYFERYKKQREEAEQFFSQNVHNYEGFAIWLEHFLSKATNQEDLFEQEIDKLIHPGYKNLFEQFHDFSEQNGNFALIAQLGFPKHYDDNTIIETLRKTYKEDFGSIMLTILYGSQKPYSDIDLFVVSNNNSRNYFNGWLDIYEVNKEEFNNWIKNLDISITDPMFSGRLIYGNKNSFEKIKKKIEEQPITKEAIDYNLREVKRLKDFYSQTPHQEKMRKSYIRSFSRNAEQLNLGNKALTLKNLNQFYDF